MGMLKSIGGFVGCPVDGGSACVVMGDRAYDDAGFGADPPGGWELGQVMMADGRWRADQIDVRAGQAAGGQNKLVAGSSTRNARDQ